MLGRKRKWLEDEFQAEPEALHACVRDGDHRRLRELLLDVSSTRDINYSALDFGPPLYFAAYCGDLAAVELLLAAGADSLVVSEGNAPQLTAIGKAALQGHRAIVKRLWIRESPERNVHGLRPTQTPLVVAATQGHVAIVEELLDLWHGWSHDTKAQALLWAARKWRANVATSLLSQCSFEVSTVQEALHYAIGYRIMEYDDLPKYEGIDYLDQQLLIALLIDGGANPNSRPSGKPLVCRAATSAGLTGALTTLLEHGADPNQPSDGGQSALHILAKPVSTGPSNVSGFLQNESAIRLLLKYGASTSQQDENGNMPLHRAAYELDLRLFKLYLSSRPERDRNQTLAVRNHGGETLLHFASAGCCIETMEFLIGQGLDINAVNANGWTPLLCALVPTEKVTLGGRNTTAIAEAVRAARLLLSRGAEAAKTTAEGWTPLHCLALHRDGDRNGLGAELATDLLSRGVDPEARAPLLSPDGRGSSPEASLPWGHRLRGVMTDPSNSHRIIRPNLPPIFWAAERGAVGVISALLAHGVDISPVNDMTPARMAAESPFLERDQKLAETIIELLLSYGRGNRNED
ncbi:ankyrin [Hypoxylon argillaceum]|nr:ankyrin [Hypoxylon argillaceum]